MLLKNYARDWFNISMAKAKINTHAMYDNAINKHIIPAMGHIPLDKIKKSDAQHMINEHWEHPRTCQVIRVTLI